jgi:type II secretory pathway pseudopilin PulG
VQNSSRQRRIVSQRVHGDQDGFTIVELLIASMVIFVALTSFAYVETDAMVDVALGRQRQVANSLDATAMEQVRALPFATVAAGLVTSDVGGDTNVHSCTVGSTSYTYCYGGEPIPNGTPSPNPPVPLYPHKSTTTLNSTPYTVSTYVTNYNGTTSPNVLRVTVIASWTKALRGGVSSQVSVQSLVYSPPSGCLQNTTHPFAAPCQPTFYAATSDGQGAVLVTPNTTSGLDTSGSAISLSAANLEAARSEATLDIEQVSTTNGLAQNSGASLSYGSTSQTASASSATAVAGDDPAGNNSPYQTLTTATQSATALSVTSGNLSTLSLNSSGGDSGSSVSTTTATQTNVCNDLSGLAQTDSLPCGSDKATQAAASSATLGLKAGSGGTDLGAITLGSVASETTSGFVSRDTAPDGSYCTSTTGDGCADARATRSVGTVQIGGLPANLRTLASSLIPSGWASGAGYLVQITGWTDSVSAESGVGSSAPAASASGTISYWNGSGYSSATVGSNRSLNVPTVSISCTGACAVGGQPLTIIITTSALSSGAVTTSDPDKSGCVVNGTSQAGTRCATTTGSSSSPEVDIDYYISWGSLSWDLVVHFNLGTLAAQSSYGPAPSAG